MACVGTPTSTLFTTVTSTGTTTTFSDGTSTLPGSVSTAVTQSCVSASLGSNVTCVSTVDITLSTTVPGVVSTIQIPITLTNLVTQTLPTETLFASCSDTQVSQSSTSSSASLTPTTPTEIPVVSTTPSSSIGPVIITQIVTPTLSPTSTVIASSTSVQSTTVQNIDNDSISTKAAPIISGVVGGFVGLICLVGFLWFLIRRRQRWHDIFESEDDILPVRHAKDRHGRFDLDADVEPKPYQYGLVGYSASPNAGGIPLGRSSSLPTDMHDATSHGRQRSSLVPLMLPGMRTAASSLSSTSGSTKPTATVTEFVVKRRPPAHHAQHSSTSSKLSQPITVASRNPMAEFGPLDGDVESSRAGSPTSIQEPRRQLQIVNTPLSPPLLGSPREPQESTSSLGKVTTTKAKEGKRQSTQDIVIVHTDGGRVDPNGVGTSASNGPPAYDA